MKAIALQDIGGTGKTTTLKMLIESIKEIFPNPLGEGKDGLHDAWACFRVNHTVVYITSVGDLEDYIKLHYNRALQMKAQIFICAVRSHGDTVAFLKREADEWYMLQHARLQTNNQGRCQEIRESVDAAEVKTLLNLIHTI